MGAFNVL